MIAVFTLTKRRNNVQDRRSFQEGAKGVQGTGPTMKSILFLFFSVFLIKAYLSARAVYRTCSSKKMFLKFCEIHWKTLVLETLLGFRPTTLSIFKNIFFYRTPPVAASVSSNMHRILEKVPK